MGSMQSSPERPRKRSASHSTTEQQQPTRRRRTSPPSQTHDDQQVAQLVPDSLHAVQSLAQLSAAISRRSEQAVDGVVGLSREEVAELSQHVNDTVASFLHKPATTEDMLRLLGDLRQVLPYASAPDLPQLLDMSVFQDSDDDTSRRGRRSRSRKHAPALPADVITLIVQQLRQLYEEEPYEGLGMSDSGGRSSWKELKRLGFINRTWGSVCYQMYSTELHIKETRSFPVHAKFLRLNPSRATDLTRLFVQVYDFEFSLVRSSSDEGFSLPDIITLAPNLTSLSLLADRNTSYSPYRRRRESSTFHAYLGGVDLPALITSNLKKLRTLVYGAPCSLADIGAFTTALPELRSLDITGDVDHTQPPSVFEMCSPNLHRFWAPTAVFTVGQLHRIISSSRVNALAFTFDLDEVYADQPPPEEKVTKNLERLEKLFERVGPQLRSLLVMSPHADAPDPPGRFRGGPGGMMGGPGAANLLTTITLALAGAPPNLAPNAGGAPAGGAPAPAPVPVINASAAAGPAPRAGRARAGRGGPAAAAPQPAPQAPAPPAPAGNVNANAGGPQVHVFPFPFPAASPPTPFFEAIISNTPSLHHLELYGRRYSASLVSHLQLLPLEHLALTVPVDEQKEGTAEGLLAMVRVGASELKKLELSGRGGDWGAKERRLLKAACEDRGVVYASTEVKS